MSETVSSLPARPLEMMEIKGMDDAREYTVRPASGDVYAIVLIGGDQVHTLGYDEEAEGWVQFESAPIEYSEEAADTFEAAIGEWVQSQYGSELESGDLVMVDASNEAEKHSEAKTDDDKDVPWVVEQGLESEYDCPDCEYYETGLSTGPHAFLDYLQEAHGYSSSEAFEIQSSRSVWKTQLGVETPRKLTKDLLSPFPEWGSEWLQMGLSFLAGPADAGGHGQAFPLISRDQAVTVLVTNSHLHRRC